MNLEQLKQLDIIARQGTLSSASKILHTSQSALSRSMQRLEAELGQELFSRSKNSVELNEAGLIVVDHARAMLREERFMRDALDRLMQRESTLLVGTVAPAPVWRLTSLAVERFPGTIISPITLDEGEVIHRFVNRDIDLAITREPLDIPTSREVRFMDEHLSVLMPANHPLASQASVTFPQIDGERFLVDSSAGFWLDVVRRRMPHTKFIEQSDRTVLRRLVSGGDALSFATNETEFWGTPEGFVRVPIADREAHATFYLMVLTDAPERVREIVDLMAESVGAQSEER